MAELTARQGIVEQGRAGWNSYESACKAGALPTELPPRDALQYVLGRPIAQFGRLLLGLLHLLPAGSERIGGGELTQFALDTAEGTEDELDLVGDQVGRASPENAPQEHGAVGMEPEHRGAT